MPAQFAGVLARIDDELDEIFVDYVGDPGKGRPGARTNAVTPAMPLNHLRQAAEEQRDQGRRQHEQQLRHLQAGFRQLSQTLGTTQGQLTGLSRDNARLAAELSEAHAQSHQVQTEARLLRDELAVASEAGRPGRGAGPVLGRTGITA